MISDHVADIKERIIRTGMGLRDALSVLDMADMALPGESGKDETSSPYEVFGDLNKLIDRTVRGTRIERFKPGKDKQPFHTFEIHTEEGNTLGYLNLMYFRKRIPCYYLVYVEVVAPFRRLGLGHKVLGNFMRFLKEKGAVGLLDNIIPPNDPTYEIYTKLGWRDITTLVRT
jgi:GNAT superfamily N-acetyltransferase